MVSYDGMSHTYKFNYHNHRLFVVISFGFPWTETMVAFQLLLSWSCLCNLVDILVWALIFKLLNMLSLFQFVASITNFELFSLSEVYSIQATKAGVVLPMDKHTLSHPEGFPWEHTMIQWPYVKIGCACGLWGFQFPKPF